MINQQLQNLFAPVQQTPGMAPPQPVQFAPPPQIAAPPPLPAAQAQKEGSGEGKEMIMKMIMKMFAGG